MADISKSASPSALSHHEPMELLQDTMSTISDTRGGGDDDGSVSGEDHGNKEVARCRDEEEPMREVQELSSPVSATESGSISTTAADLGMSTELYERQQQEMSRYHQYEQASGESPPVSPTSPTSPISPTTPSGAASGSAPLLPEIEKTESENQSEGTASEDPKDEKKASFSKAEYQIAFSHFLRIFSYTTRGDRFLLYAAAVASILTGVTLPLMNVVFGQLVGAFNSFYTPDSGETKALFTEDIDRNVLYLVYLFVVRLFLDYVAVLGFRMVSVRISAAVRLAYLKALFKQPISVLDTLPAGQTAAIITITANILQMGISEKLSMLLQSTSMVLTALIVAFQYSWLLTLVTSTGLLFIIVFYCVTIPVLVKMTKEVEHADRMSSSIASEVFGSIRMVAACEAEGKMAKRYSGWVLESRRRGLLMSPLVAIQQAPVFFAIHAMFALSFWFAIRLYMDYQITSVTTIIIVLMSVMTIVMSIGTIASPISAAASSAGAAAIFFTIIDAPQPMTHGITESEISAENDIVLENVNFAYPVRPDVKVLNNLSVTFPAGKLTAIVGASGSGKSTIVGLLERWYELDGNMTDNMLTLFFRNGNITIGGRKLHEIDLKWWRSQIGLVQQEPFLFNDTIYKNVEYGLIGTEWEYATDEKKNELIKRACKESFADEFISRLPEGYNTMVGDSGIKLSGGQRQRIAIARSVVKQARIMIFDEATSAIDVRGEKIVQAALDKVSKNRTTITIAHRLSTIMKADNIVVLQKGQVVQQGTHEELMADPEGPYYALASAQKLSMSETSTAKELVEPEAMDMEPIILDDEVPEEVEEEDLEMPVSKTKRFFGSFMLFLWEQKPRWGWYLLMLIGSLGAGAAVPLHAFLFAKLISLFSFWGQYLQDQTNWWCLMFTILAAGVGASYLILGWSSNTISFNITSFYRQEYFQNVLLKPVSYYDGEENSVGALTSRMASDPQQLQQLLGINMAIVIISIFNILGSIGLSFYFGWKLTLLTVCSSFPIILAAGFFRIRYETQFEKMNYAVFAESSKFATESIGAFRTVSSLTLETKICGRYETLLRDHSKKAFRKARFSTLVFAMSDSISLLCMAFVLWYGGQLLANKEYTPFQYLVIYLAVVQGSTTAGQSLSFGPNVAQAFAAATRIQAMRPPPEKEESSSELLDLSVLETNEKGPQGVKIELKNVWFKYPTRDVPVLKGLDMTIERGQFAAIVGPSGCGKTSIISLLERFYQVQRGQILYHDIDIDRISLREYRRTISLVAQEASLFSGTIRENILLGVDESTITDTALHQTCRDAEIHDFISSLPEGYDTAVGAKGIALSGGQKQRIAIARALIRNPRVLLLDEATSNLDSETERSVQAVFEKTAKGRTMVVVAHRLATVQNADVIFVVSDGVVVEKGDHASLLRQRGVYYQMCQSQALDR
ncbi:p-loop containing nucleoside triphosphate hydrolase-14 [Coleophoma cylindrospora]|uniref:p-loop containing nucleoside triphosphate hydrolase-14 n=1 Tax=Coleophoma cylindrospora TaxID=1849047 RepID=A0A3D8SSC7_9HELO|nr:p-loop containing nucleoside triphosphate hydrolase-14 [Coleophoma cylindrospora]